MVKNIVFDFGGVLVQYDFTVFFTSILGSRERARWFMQHVFTGEINAEMDRGEHEPAYFFEQQKQLWPGYADVLRQFDEHYTDIFTAETEGMRTLMTELRAQGYRLLGLSNWSSRVYEVMQKFSIFDLLDGYLLSKDVHQLKPEPAIYHSFFEKFGVEPAECVFIDDKPENIDGARAVGMPGLVFRDTPQLRRDLTPLLQTSI